MPSKKNVHLYLDRLGSTGALLCAIHCALLPLVIVLLPSLGLVAWLGEGFEQAFVVAATLLGLFSMVWGYRRHHVVRPLQLVMLGLSGLWAGMLIESLHHSFALHAAVMTASGSLVALAHYFNLKFNGLYAVSAVRTTTKQ